MRTVTLICYDISDPKRLRQVFEICRSFGDHLQYSIFCATLTPMSRAELITQLTAVMHQREDRILLIRLGPDTSDTHSRFTALGRQWTPNPDDPAIF